MVTWNGIELPGAAEVREYGRSAAEQARWAEDRRGFLTASEWLTALGESPYKSAYTLAAEKAGLIEPEPLDSIPAEIGSYLESMILDRLYKNHPVIRPPKGERVMVISKNLPFLAATPDSFLDGNGDGFGVGEVKTTSEFARGEWEDDKAPLAAQVQLIGQLFITGLQWGELIALIGNRDIVSRKVERKDRRVEELLATMLDELTALWGRVQRKELPPVDGSESTAATLKGRWSRATEGKVAVIPPEYWDDYHHLKDAENKAKEGLDLLKNRLKGMAEDADTLKGPDGRTLFKRVTVHGYTRPAVSMDESYHFRPTKG